MLTDSSQLCWFMKNGNCRFGSSCNFSHGEASSFVLPLPKPDQEQNYAIQERPTEYEPSSTLVMDDEELPIELLPELLARKDSE